MTTSVATFLTRIATDLSEADNTFPTGAWTVPEMLRYLNYAEREFLKLTGIIKSDSSIVAANGASIIFDRPANTMELLRISFNGKPLKKQRSIDLERENRNWRSNTVGKPQYWHEDLVPNSQFEIDKCPAAGGTLRVFADYIYSEYADTSGNIHLKDCWEPYLRWKVLRLALEKDGDNQDLGRSQYAEKRYRIGVALALRIMMENASDKLSR